MPTRRTALAWLAAGAVSGCSPATVDATAPWREPGAGERDPRRWALAHAILAPNPHNRQPWLIDLPILGRLFSSERNDRNKTEIVLLITPRVVRNLAAGTPDRTEHLGGTESAVGAPPLRVQGPGRIELPPAGGARRAAGPGSDQPEALEAEPVPTVPADPAPPPAPAEPR